MNDNIKIDRFIEAKTDASNVYTRQTEVLAKQAGNY